MCLNFRSTHFCKFQKITERIGQWYGLRTSRSSFRTAKELTMSTIKSVITKWLVSNKKQLISVGISSGKVHDMEMS